jgi:hypothetical protein
MFFSSLLSSLVDPRVQECWQWSSHRIPWDDGLRIRTRMPLIGTLRSVRSCWSTCPFPCGILAHSDLEISERVSSEIIAPSRSGLRFGSRQDTDIYYSHYYCRDRWTLFKKRIHESVGVPSDRSLLSQDDPVPRNTGCMNRTVGPTRDRRHTTLQTAKQSVFAITCYKLHIDGRYAGVIATAWEAFSQSSGTFQSNSPRASSSWCRGCRDVRCDRV